jgi:hypothetical protein
MVSQRQIAANRKNARKSTGPRSGAGKHRASRNAFRHGLSLSISATGALAKQVEGLAREIAGDTENPITLEHAWAAALAELERARARRTKVALIERARAFGDFDPPQLFSSVREAIGFSKAVARDMSITRKPIDRAAALLSQEPDGSVEAIRRAIPELLKLDRYERRAAARRDRAISALVKVE